MKTNGTILIYALTLFSVFARFTFSESLNYSAEEINLTSPQIEITNETILGTTLSTAPRQVSLQVDTSGFPEGYAPVLDVKVFVSTDTGKTYAPYTMADTGSYHFVGEIPGFTEMTFIMYIYQATETNYNIDFVSSTYSYQVFVPGGVNTLVVLNGYEYTTGFPQGYYFGAGEWPANIKTLDFEHDVWAYGKLTSELLSYYDNVLEICTSTTDDINSDTISTWLNASGSHNYMLSGQEWLGIQTNWTNGPHTTGEFIFDILGVNYEYNDIDYAMAGDQLDPTVVFPQRYTLLGNSIFNKYAQVSNDSNWNAPMTYDPYYEIDIYNWIDGVDFEVDVQVDMKALGKDGNIYNIAGHRILPAGNKIAFFTYDPLFLDSDTDSLKEYYWYGFMNSAPHAEPLLNWFGVILNVEKENAILPIDLRLEQNYPNPFNPSTIIRYQLPENGIVILKIYDILGSEVATLVNEEKVAGRYEVNWNASSLASGVYIYTLQVNGYTTSRKMLLLK